MKYYAVKNGREPGIYNSWAECQKQIHGFKNASYKSFTSRKEAEEFITEHGTLVRTPSGYWQQVPQVSIAQTYMKQMGKFATEFGLTPASRSRLIADAGKPTPGDEMEELLGGDVDGS